MQIFDIAAVCLVLTAVFAYLNHRFLGLPTTVGVMTIALALSLVIVALNAIGIAIELRTAEESLLHAVHFSEVVLQGLLSLLLFAGSLHVDARKLSAYRIPVATLAVVSTAASTLLIGFSLWLVLPWLGIALSLSYCLLFGALISPTDPVAVMGILRAARVPKSLEVTITGESLFNDGVGVVLFSLLLTTTHSGTQPTLGAGLQTLAVEAGGGVALGAGMGYLVFMLLRSVDQYQVEVLLTLALVVGGYALANMLQVSGPLAMVVAGLIIGNPGRSDAMSDTTRQYVDMFWELIDEILNAVLFLLIGMQVLQVNLAGGLLVAGLAAIVLTLLARMLTVGLTTAIFGKAFGLPDGAWYVLTWGGLRGGISVALALSILPSPGRDTVLALTYCVVVFSILVQGATVGRVVQFAVRRN